MLADFLILLLRFVRVARVWPEVCLISVCLGGLTMTSRQELAEQIRYVRKQKRLAKYYWKESVNSDSQVWADISMRAAKEYAYNARVFAPGSVEEIDDIFALLDTPAAACSDGYEAAEAIQFEALGELNALRKEVEAAIREHLQLGGLLTDDSQTVSRLIRGRASMALRAFPA